MTLLRARIVDQRLRLAAPATARPTSSRSPRASRRPRRPHCRRAGRSCAPAVAASGLPVIAIHCCRAAAASASWCSAAQRRRAAARRVVGRRHGAPRAPTRRADGGCGSVRSSARSTFNIRSVRCVGNAVSIVRAAAICAASQRIAAAMRKSSLCCAAAAGPAGVRPHRSEASDHASSDFWRRACCSVRPHSPRSTEPDGRRGGQRRHAEGRRLGDATSTQHPELGNRETRTAKLVADHLRSLGLEVRTGVAHTGVVGVLRGGKPGPVIALRADMDALPVTEQVDVPFKSLVKTEYRGEQVGVMHACGHDGHTAILMGVAQVLASMRAQLARHGRVRVPARRGRRTGRRGGRLQAHAQARTRSRPATRGNVWPASLGDDRRRRHRLSRGTRHGRVRHVSASS